MSLFFETISIHEGKAAHLSYHNRRLRRTRKEFFGIDQKVDLEKLIDPPSQGWIRCKVIYDHRIKKIEYHPYTPRKIRSFRLIHSELDYSHKALDRREIDRLFALRGSCDEILLYDSKKHLRDSSIANIALCIDGEWLTPETSLLRGTTRERLLEEGMIKEAPLRTEDLSRSSSFALLNAMIGLMPIPDAHFLE